MIWCPYTDAEVSFGDATDEHIIPLALGGHDGFRLAVHGKSNSELGSKIDGALANEFHISRARVKHDARGHSGRAPEYRMKKVREQGTGRPLQVRWGKRLEVYDPIARRYRDDALTFEAEVKLDIHLRLRFLAKTFLSAGYRIYGDLFRRAVAHENARVLMRKPLHELTEAEKTSLEAKAFAWYHCDIPHEEAAEEFAVQESTCKVLQATLLVFFLGRNRLNLYGGILGEYLGMLSIPADTTDFPKTGRHDLGFITLVRNGELISGSYRVLLRRLFDSMPPEMRPAGPFKFPDDPVEVEPRSIRRRRGVPPAYVTGRLTRWSLVRDFGVVSAPGNRND